jgi:acyl carrier protein
MTDREPPWASAPVRLARDEATSVRRLVALAVASIAPRTDIPVDPELDLQADLGYSSITLIELSVVIEHAFDLEEISGERASGIRTVGDVADYVLDRLAERGRGIPGADVEAAERRIAQAFGDDGPGDGSSA